MSQSPWVAIDAATIPAKRARELRDAWEDFVEGRPEDDEQDAGRPPIREPIADSWRRSRDAGGTWEELGEGLPDPFYVGVLRDAMCADSHERTGLYLGTRDGGVWTSTDAGERWRPVVQHLPDVVVVRAAAL